MCEESFRTGFALGNLAFHLEQTLGIESFIALANTAHGSPGWALLESIEDDLDVKMPTEKDFENALDILSRMIRLADMQRDSIA